MTFAVRGATKIENNSIDCIETAVNELIADLLKRNNIRNSRIIVIQFSITDDITAINPATALRKSGFSEVPLFCSQEPGYEGSQPGIIRVLLLYRKLFPFIHRSVPVYLNGAGQLRADLFPENHD